MSLSLQGCLYLILNQQQIKVECKGQSIKLVFSSFKALRNFIYFLKNFKNTLVFQAIKNEISHLDLKYYINNFIVGQSNADLQPTWLGNYVGLENSKIYPQQIFSYLISCLKKSST